MEATTVVLKKGLKVAAKRPDTKRTRPAIVQEDATKSAHKLVKLKFVGSSKVYELPWAEIIISHLLPNAPAPVAIMPVASFPTRPANDSSIDTIVDLTGNGSEDGAVNVKENTAVLKHVKQSAAPGRTDTVASKQPTSSPTKDRAAATSAADGRTQPRPSMRDWLHGKAPPPVRPKQLQRPTPKTAPLTRRDDPSIVIDDNLDSATIEIAMTYRPVPPTGPLETANASVPKSAPIPRSAPVAQQKGHYPPATKHTAAEGKRPRGSMAKTSRQEPYLLAQLMNCVGTGSSSNSSVRQAVPLPQKKTRSPKKRHGALSYTPKRGRGSPNISGPHSRPSEWSSSVGQRHPLPGVTDGYRIPRMNKQHDPHGRISKGHPNQRSRVMIPRSSQPGRSREIVQVLASRSAEMFAHTVSKKRRKVAATPVAPKFTSRFPFYAEEDDETSVTKLTALTPSSELSESSHERRWKEMERLRPTTLISPCSRSRPRNHNRKPRKKLGNLEGTCRNKFVLSMAPQETTSEQVEEIRFDERHELQYESFPGPRILDCICGIAEDLNSNCANSQFIQCTSCALWSHLRCVQRNEEVTLALKEASKKKPRVFSCLRCAENRLNTRLRPSPDVRAEVSGSIWCLPVRVLDFSSDVWASKPDNEIGKVSEKPRSALRHSRKASALSATDIAQKAENVEVLRRGLAGLSLTSKNWSLTERLLLRRLQERDKP